ncbi:ATP-dependent DNA helicase [Actinomycetospora chibensis]|uniref:DNA 5'-3' helicase n=1 Tax=Actinomycetospora chibensis TaxID=663606 RepID=A0ABV9RGU8_9PSEU|nr:ATP-dependent DNA helicase [Actinomycetospora chibensis]MDD7923570.1 ATP-dependent DNA helicase [Actinomycetospora chibensis]
MGQTSTATGPPPVAELLAAAVSALGGSEREGQQQMAGAVERSLRTGEHLAVQAGTGTGKSLAYLVPAIRHALESEQAVVVSTATIALQTQLVDRDLPRLTKALQPVLGREPTFAILKGRANYLCKHKIESGAQAAADDPGDEQLFDPFQVSALGRQVTRLHEWAEQTTTGDRDELVPGVTDRAWRQVSVSARECLGASRCPVAEDCFSEHARRAAGSADVVVTNHAMLAIDAIEGRAVLPDHDVVVVDEAHNLVDRVTSVATGELTAAAVSAAARRCGKLVDQALSDALLDAGEGLDTVLAEVVPGRWERLPEGVGRMLTGIRDASWSCRQALGPDREKGGRDDDATARKFALALVEEVHDVAGRLLTAFDREDPATRPDVVWCSETERNSTRTRALHVAPLSVAGLLASRLFGRSTVVLTSATLALGGSFDALARQWGLPASTGDRAITEPVPDDGSGHDPTQHADRDPATNLVWHGLDVGSPFAHGKAGILYVARHLPPPGRDGLSPACLDEIEALVRAAGGRALGLFSSMRAAKQAAEDLRTRWDGTVLCQGDDATGTLVTKFAADVESVLFGTLSLWQGVDVPGESLQLVMIDRIPFPRPDDPLVSARQRAVDARGGNGFLTVSATHAALLLAQGAGRLLRGTGDRGVVALLDSRVATKQYGGFLRGSLPPFWSTQDPAVVRGALERLRGA